MPGSKAPLVPSTALHAVCLRWFFLGALLVLSFPTTSAQAQIYKWVDANGKVHYTDQKPPEHARSTQDMTTQIDSSVAPPDEGELRRRAYLKSAEHLSDRASRPEPGAAGSEKPRDSSQCWWARVEAEILKLPMPLYRSDRGELRPHWFPDTYEGPRTYIPDNERPAAVAQNRRLLESHCGDPLDAAAQRQAYNGWLAQDWCESSRAELAEAQAAGKRTTKDRIARLQREMRSWCGPRG